MSLPSEPDSPEFAKFSASYKAKYGEDPDSFALKSYDAFMLMVYAINATDGKPASIVQYLHTFPGYQGASGFLSFDEQGDLRRQDYSRLVYRGGHLVPYTSE